MNAVLALLLATGLAANAIVLLPKHAPLSKQAYLDEEFAGRPAGVVNPKASFTNFRAVVDGDTAGATYDVVEPTPLGDQVFEVRTSRLDTYVRVAGSWRLLSMAVVEEPAWPEVAPIASTLLDEYAGTYRISGGIVVITNESGHLMQAMTGQPKGELFAENATTFFDRTDSPLARTVFERDASGQVVAQVYRAMGQKIRAVKVR